MEGASMRRLCVGIVVVVGVGLVSGSASAAATCPLVGDMNCDGVVTWRDIDPFVAAMGNQSAGHSCPIGYWPLDGFTRDFGCFEHHGVLNGNPVYSSSSAAQVAVGMSLVLDGVGDYVDLGAGLLASGRLDQFTLTVWLKAGPQNQGGACGTVFCDETPDGRLELAVRATDGKAVARVCLEGGQVCELLGPQVTDECWHHVALRKNAEGVALFVDGCRDAFCPALGPLQAGSGRVAIGARCDAQPVELFQGLIDEVWLHDRALSDAQIVGQVVLTIPVGHLPRGVATDGTYIFVANSEWSYPTPGSGTLDVLDACDYTRAVEPLPLGGCPQFVAVQPNGTLVYVTSDCYYANSMLWVDTSDWSFGTIDTGDRATHRVIFSPDGQFAYASLHAADWIGVIDTSTNLYSNKCPAGHGPAGLAISADGTTLYATMSWIDQLWVINLPDCAHTTVNVGGHPGFVALTPDEAYCYVGNTGQGGYSVSVVDVAAGAVTATIPLPGSPYDGAMSVDGQYLYVTSTAGYLTVISTASNAIVGAVACGSEPYGVALSPDDRFLYVTNFTGPGTLTVLPAPRY